MAATVGPLHDFDQFLEMESQMDAEVISASILREALFAGATTMHEVKSRIGTSTAHLLHESLRIKNFPSKDECLHDESTSVLRKCCQTYYVIRAAILELAFKLDTMRNLDYLPRYHQQIISLEVLKIYASLAHAIGTSALSLELEDLSFRYLFPYSYLYVDSCKLSHETGSNPLIDVYKNQLLKALKHDTELVEIVDNISIKGRCKSRFRTMKRLQRHGHKPEEVNDILSLRIILYPKPGGDI